MSRDLSRLFKPRSIALFGGGWSANVIAQLQKSGFAGDIWPVHPTREEIGGIPCLRSIDALPAPPDASFVAVSRDKSIDVVRHLAAMGAGGAVCFASGFRESGSEGAGLQSRLVKAAGGMPLLGPNCYGFLNYLDNVTVWPDQHGGVPVERGVAILAQSSNIAINMTMQRRSLPLAMLATIGNQAQTGYADIAAAMMEDERITVIGLYLEGLGNIRALEALAETARRKGVPLVALKTGKSEKARASGLTHTASLTGAAAAASALFERLGIVETDNVETFLETLKLLHAIGPLPGNRITSVSCSGGEAGLMADMGADSEIGFADFSDGAALLLRDQLGPLVTIANPFDYHTFIWGDVAAMTRTFATVMADGFDLTVFVLDLPRPDRCDPAGHDCSVEAIIAARAQTGANVAVLSLLPENLGEATAARFAEVGIATLNGIAAGLAAIDAAIRLGRLKKRQFSQPVILGPSSGPPILLNEIQAKQALAGYGLIVPRAVTAETVEDLALAARSLAYPLALKGLGVAHKSEAGAVKLNLADEAALLAAARKLTAPQGYLAEEMISGVIAELIVGVIRDETGLLLMTIGAGGVLAELTGDTAHLLLPASREDIANALSRLKVAKLLNGWRSGAKADIETVAGAILSIARYASEHAGDLAELDVNPLMVCADRAVAADALIVHTKRGTGDPAAGETDTRQGVESMTFSDQAPVRAKVRGAVLEVTLDRPKANAIDLATSRIMGDIFMKFRDDANLRVAVLTSAGEKFFCPGWDLKAAAGGDEVDGDYGVGGFGGLQELPGLNKPVICAVNGICCGGGLELALSCDIILAAEHATFALPEIRSGTVADAASIKLPKRIPYHIAMEMLLTGRWLDAEEANRWGFVNRVVPAEKLMDEAREMADLLASGPPLVMAAIKEVVREAEDIKFQDALNRITKRQFPTVDTLYGSEDMKEGFNAFAEKRDPVWKGR